MSHWLILPILLPLFAGSLLLLPSAGSAACRCSRRWH